MRASDLLGARDSAALRSRLLPVVPEQVPVRLLPGVGVVRPRWIAAITLPWGIYVRRDILEGDGERLSRLVVHELAHARQWRVHGPVGFLRRYLFDYLMGRLRRLGHREAYLRIGLEMEASSLAGQV